MDTKNNHLYIDGCDTIELAKEYGTPLYIYSQSKIESEINQLKETFIKPYPKNRIAYGAKAFFTVGFAQFLNKMDICVDVVSGGELYTAIKAKFPADRIEFNGNNKSSQELEMAIDYGIGRIIIDNIYEMSLIEKICKEKNKKIKVLFRITPGVQSDTHDYIVTGKKDSKFGIPVDHDIIIPYIESIIASPYLELVGLHFHLGSQILENSSYLEATDIMLNLVGEVKKQLTISLQS